MAHILKMPRQGNTVESCVITAWKIKEGDNVTAETIVCEVETDKASFEVPAGESGIVLKIISGEGDDVPVLSPIAIIGKSNEAWETVLSKLDEIRDLGLGTGDSGDESKIINKIQSSNNETTPHSTLDIPNSSLSSFASPRARNLAEKESLSLEMVSGTGPDGRIIERDVKAALEQRPPLTAAAKAAGSRNVSEEGSGFAGRITISDIESSLPSSHSSFHIPHSSLNIPNSPFTEVPIKGIRKVIADRMLKSISETAQFTLNASACVSKLQNIRSKINKNEIQSEELKFSKITINDLILFAVSKTLPQFLYMNAHKTADAIRTFKQVHLGFAVDTPRGLMVPVIRNADSLSLAEISVESKRLAAACQSASAKPDELTGSTFTISNLGSLGITSFTPVLNIPEVAILGVCSIEMKPIASNENEGGCVFEPHIGFSLTINHQAVDGAPAARFLNALCETVADIDVIINLQ